MTIDIEAKKFAFDFNDYPKTLAGALDVSYDVTKSFRDRDQ